MIWHESITDRKTVEQALKKGRPVSGVYLVCTTNLGKIEIMSFKEAFKPVYASFELMIAGVAMGRQNAIELLADMFGDHIKTYGSIDGFVQHCRQ